MQLRWRDEGFDLDIDSTDLFHLSVSTSTWHSTGRAPMGDRLHASRTQPHGLETCLHPASSSGREGGAQTARLDRYPVPCLTAVASRANVRFSQIGLNKAVVADNHPGDER